MSYIYLLNEGPATFSLSYIAHSKLGNELIVGVLLAFP